MKDRTIWLLIAAALILGFGYAFLLWCLVGAPGSKPMTAQWVKIQLPHERTYVSYLPCIRTSGWPRPIVTCYPTEARSVGLGDPGDEPPDCRMQYSGPQPEC